MSVQTFYRLDENKNVVPCTWVEWIESRKDDSHRLAADSVKDLLISTVFLGTPYEPAFETIVMDKHYEDFARWHCYTHAEALEQHQKAIDWASKERSHD